MTILRRLLVGVVGLALLFCLALAGLFLYAPYADGPIELIAGGPFRGAPVAGPEPDWSTVLANQSRVEIQTGTSEPRSVTVAVLELDGKVYVPATLRPDEKRWPKQIEAEPRVLLRVGDLIWERLGVRVREPALFARLIESAVARYNASYFEADKTWFFHLAPPSPRESPGAERTS